MRERMEHEEAAIRISEDRLTRWIDGEFGAKERLQLLLEEGEETIRAAMHAPAMILHIGARAERRRIIFGAGVKIVEVRSRIADADNDCWLDAGDLPPELMPASAEGVD